jgi:Leucine-rich repeat (LRR) protein
MSVGRFVALAIGILVILGGALYLIFNGNDKTDQGGQPVTETTSGTNLDYSNRQLTTFPKEILDMTDATSLNLSNNRLTGALPAEIRHLTELEELNVSNNRMTGVPAEIGQLKKLKILNYNDNRLTGLPLELGNLNQLEVLDLRRNNISQYDLDQIRPKLPNTEIKL